jgi:serine/threonine protein phosphatase PrpC
MELEAGSTGTVCLLTLEEAKRVLYVAHVGDSSAYLFDDNTFEKLTPEHRCDNQAEVQRVKEVRECNI